MLLYLCPLLGIRHKKWGSVCVAQSLFLYRNKKTVLAAQRFSSRCSWGPLYEKLVSYHHQARKNQASLSTIVDGMYQYKLWIFHTEYVLVWRDLFVLTRYRVFSVFWRRGIFIYLFMIRFCVCVCVFMWKYIALSMYIQVVSLSFFFFNMFIVFICSFINIRVRRRG